jgi:hypothetical protein
MELLIWYTDRRDNDNNDIFKEKFSTHTVI